MSSVSHKRKTYSIAGPKTDLRQVVLDGYFESKKWRDITTERLRKFPKCLLCETEAIIVHPMGLDDEVLSGQRENELVTLCGQHYSDIVIDDITSRWRTVAESNAVLRSMAHKQGMHRFLKSVVSAGRDHVKPKQPAFRCRLCGKNPCPPHSPECGKCRKGKR